MNHNDKKKAQEEMGADFWKDHQRNWRSWGSWFSWGSPIGLALFFAIPMVAFGIMYWLMHH